MTAGGLKSYLATIALGVLIAAATVLGLSLVRPVWFAFAFGALVAFLPTLVLRDPRAYWLFLFVISIPFDIAKRTTTWLVPPWELAETYSTPASGTVSVDLYLTDVVLFALVLPWLARLCLRRERVYFPRFAYLFVAFLAWAFVISLLKSESLYLSMFEMCRLLLYFLSFLYIINNVVTRHQFRAVLLGLMVGLVIESSAVIVFYQLGLGTGTHFLSSIYRERDATAKAENQTLYVALRGEDSKTKRSPGTFSHPSHAAYYLEYILSVLLAFLLAGRRDWTWSVLAGLFVLGFAGLYLTFSRSGLLSLAFGATVMLGVAQRKRLVSNTAVGIYVFLFAVTVLVLTPKLVEFLLTRPETLTHRFKLIDLGLAIFVHQPFTGVGLNNSSVVLEGARILMAGGQTAEITVIHNHYLNTLIEVGIVGAALFFGFFIMAIVNGLRALRAAEPEVRLLMLGIVGAFAGLAIHNLGDPFGGHALHAMLWLFTSLALAAARRAPAEAAAPVGALARA